MATQQEIAEKTAELFDTLGYRTLALDVRSGRHTAAGALRWILTRQMQPRPEERALLQRALDAIEPPRTQAVFRGSR